VVHYATYNMTVTESLHDKPSIEGGQEANEPLFDVIASVIGEVGIIQNQPSTIFSEHYWRNPAIKSRVKAQRIELALTAMGSHYSGFDQLIHTQWVDTDTSEGGKLSVRAVSVEYAQLQHQLVQEQIYNSYGRLIEEYIYLVPSVDLIATTGE